jgi:hypothetical protein
VEFVLVLALGGGVWALVGQGQGLIDRVRHWTLKRQVAGVETALRSYLDLYGALPGDDARAAHRFQRPPARLLVDGRLLDRTGDGHLDGRPFEPRNPEAETFMAWRDLRYAHLLDGEAELSGISALPETPFGLMDIGETVLGLPLGLCLARLPGPVARALEDEEDDGDPASGRIRAIVQTGRATVPKAAPPAADAAYRPDAVYLLCLRLDVFS